MNEKYDNSRMIRHAVWSQNTAHARVAFNRASAEMASVFEYLEPHPREAQENGDYEDQWIKKNTIGTNERMLS